MLQTGIILHQRYEILRLIAEGGMGAVYEGRDLRFGGSPVAIKRCLLTGELIQRAFVREAELLANLSHPGVPKVRDLFVEADGHYLVMEYLPGRDLEEILNDRAAAIPTEEALGWIDQALDALSYMHSQCPPVIHRDLKPSNLKLTPSGHMMLIDFGLAKGNGNTSLIGYSMNFAPLEQLQGGGTDAQSDLYSLGATLYRLLTGQAPESAISRVNQIAKGHRDPLQRVNEVDTRVPSAVGQVIWDAMALEREDRLQSADEMRRRLREAMKSPAWNFQQPYTPIGDVQGIENNSRVCNFNDSTSLITQVYSTSLITQLFVEPSQKSSNLLGQFVSLLARKIEAQAGKTGAKKTKVKPVLVLAGLVVFLLLIGAAGNFVQTTQPKPPSGLTPDPSVSQTPMPSMNSTINQKPRLGEIFNIPANNPWYDTGINVKPGMEFKITASGIISPKPPYNVGPDGYRQTASNSVLPYPDAGFGALIGRIRYINGSYSNIVSIGQSSILIAQPRRSGTLILGINDSLFDDSSGNFHVRVQRIR